MQAAEILNQINTLARAGNFAAAIEAGRAGTRRHPDAIGLWLTLAALHHHLGAFADALPCIDAAIALDARLADAWAFRGSVLKALGRSGEAIDAYRRAVDLGPQLYQAADNLGNLLLAEQRPQEARDYFRRSLSINPANPLALNGLGLSFKACGQPGDAAEAFRRAIALRPDYVEAWHNLGNALREAGALADSLEAHRQAIGLDPRRAEPYNELGATLSLMRRSSEAIDVYQQAISLKPDFAEAHANLGAALILKGDLEAATASFRTALAINPDLAVAHSNYLFALHYRHDIEPAAIFQLARDYQERFARPLAATHRPHANRRDPERRLRIGYVSADLRQHPLGFFLEPVLECHDRSCFEIFCYSGVVTPDDVTRRLRDKSDHWCEAMALTDAGLADRIRADEIDILVDLSGHTGGHRLLVFARKPAPIQATWMGYLDTTGLDTVDYLITDELTTPAAEGGRFFAETLWRLPEVYQCYRPPVYAAAVAPAPLLTNGHVTFGCLNNLAKINDDVLDVWAAILDAAPSARLLLKTNNLDDAPTAARIAARFGSRGIAPERLILSGGSPHPEFLAAYGQVDIALDPFPYSGGLSTCEALWMGAPVVKLLDRRFLSRFGASFIAIAGLGALLADSPDDYVRIAAGLAAEPQRILDLREGLRQRLADSTLCRGDRFTPQLETAYRTWWQRWCAATEPPLTV